MRRIVLICFLSLLGRIECSISIGRRGTALESKWSAGHFDWYCNNSQYFTVKSSKPTLFGKSVTISLKV